MPVYRKNAERFEVPEEPMPQWGRRRGALAAAGAVAVLAGAAAFRLVSQTPRAPAADGAIDAARTCALGVPSGTDLAPDTPLPAWARHAQLQHLDEPRWPMGCAPLLTAAAEAAAREGLHPGAVVAVRTLAQDLQRTAASVDHAELLGKVRAALTALRPAASATQRVPPAAALTLDDLEAAAAFSGTDSRVATELQQNQEPILLVQQAGEATRRWCRIDERLACTAFSAPQGTRVDSTSLAGTRDVGGAPLVFESTGPGLVHGTGLSDRDVVATTAGQVLSRRLLAQGGFARADGVSFAFGVGIAAHVPSDGNTHVETESWFLTRSSHPETLIRIGGSANGVLGGQLLWERLFVTKTDASGERLDLAWRPVDDARAPLRPVFEAAPPATLLEPVEGCRTKDATVVRWGNRLAFWSEPGSFGPSLQVPTGGRLTCHDTHAAVVAVDAAGGFVHARCDRDRCVTTATDGHGLDASGRLLRLPAADREAFDVDGRLVVVAQAGLGGLRVQQAVPDAFAGSDSTLVYDDHWQDGAFHDDSTLQRYEVVVHGDRVAVVLHTARGVHAIRIEPDGRVARIASP